MTTAKGRRRAEPDVEPAYVHDRVAADCGVDVDQLRDEIAAEMDAFLTPVVSR